MRRGRLLTTALILAATALLAGCTSGGGGDPNDVSGIPEEWLTSTEEGWPSSKAHGGGVPVLSREPCLLTDRAPQVLDGDADFTDTGWGGYGSGPDGYRYICNLWKRGSYAGDLQVLRPGAAGDAATTVDQFRTQKSSAVQENSVEKVTSGQLEMLVLTRWYPTNPQGMYQALYFDEAADVLVSLEINSLDEDDFDTLTPQDVADALVETMAAAS